MKHARADYGRIQDPLGIIPEDEPVFLLRGQDAAAPTAVRAWADRAEAMGADMTIVGLARQQADEMETYAGLRNLKIPDLPQL